MTGSRPEMALFGNFGVKLRIPLCGVLGVRLRENPCFPKTCSKIARFQIENSAVSSKVSGWERADGATW